MRTFARPLVPLLGLLGLLRPEPADGRTFVIPHVLEKKGTITDTTFTFDTTLFLTYNATLNGKDTDYALVEVYLYDEKTGQLMQAATNTVCGPCGFELDGRHRKLSIKLDDLINGQGGGFDTESKAGFGVVVVSGPGADAVNLEGFVVNSHTGPFDVSVYGVEPQDPTSSPEGSPQTRRTFVMPHVLESSGRALSSSNAIDTVLYATYSGGLPGMPIGTGATLDLYLYDQATGLPMVGGKGAEICDPCSFGLGTGDGGTPPRKATIVLDDLINAAGGFGGANLKQGFAMLSVGGQDPGGVNLESFVVNSHTSPFDLSVFASPPHEVRTNGLGSTERSFVIPHIIEKSGLVGTQPFTFDTTLFATYDAGLAGLPNGQGAQLDFYLYDDSGGLMTGSGGNAICAPCTFDLGTGASGTANPRTQSIRIDDLITARGGGFDTDLKLGFGVVVVGGADPDGVALQGFVVNSHTSAFDLSVFGFEPQPIAAAARALSGAPPSGLPARAFVLPHVLERSGTVADTQFTFDTTLYATYAGGLPGTVSSNGATLKLYLYDSDSGLPLAGATSEVCNPCEFDLSQSSRKLSLTIDDLIMSRGGGFGPQDSRDAFGVAVLDGDASDVTLQAFVVNAHTSPFDLSVFGFEPQPLAAARLAPMPVQITPSPGGMTFTLPTVIGGHYVIESKNNLNDPAWLNAKSFEGNGAVQSITLSAPVNAQFYRVNGM